jgi:pimeloyl-ACP methyl ester carboxylesterase
MKSATIFNFANDVNTGLDFLAKQPEVNPKHLGLIGHSEGGLVAAIVGAKRKDLAFIVSLAGVGIPMDVIVIEQVKTVTRHDKSLTPEAAQLVVKAQQAAVAAVKRDATTNDVKTILFKLYQTLRTKKIESEALRVLSEKELEAKASMEAGILLSPGLSTAFKTKPALYWKNVRCPILALNGSKDFQVTPKENLGAIKKATAKNRDVTTTELPDLNHLFQKANTGLLDEYATIEQTMAPIVLRTLTTWLKTKTQASKK